VILSGYGSGMDKKTALEKRTAFSATGIHALFGIDPIDICFLFC
jgi:hypothetical protein